MISRFSCLSANKAFTWFPDQRINVITGKPGIGKTRFLTSLFTTLCPYPSFYTGAGTHFSVVVDKQESILRYESESQKWQTTGIEDPATLYATDCNMYVMAGKKMYRNEPGSLFPFSVPPFELPDFLSLLGHEVPVIKGLHDYLPAVVHRYGCICFYLNQYKPSTLLLDCPELYVHRSRHRYIYTILSHINKHFGVQIITTTGVRNLTNSGKSWTLSADPPFITETGGRSGNKYHR